MSIFVKLKELEKLKRLNESAYFHQVTDDVWKKLLILMCLEDEPNSASAMLRILGEMTDIELKVIKDTVPDEDRLLTILLRTYKVIKSLR